MAKRPEDRYPSAAAAAVALAAATRKAEARGAADAAEVVTKAAADGFSRDDSPWPEDTVASADPLGRARSRWSSPWLVAGTASKRGTFGTRGYSGCSCSYHDRRIHLPLRFPARQ